MQDKVIITLLVLSTVFIIWISGSQLNETHARSKKGQLCHLIIGETMKGGILNEIDYIRVNKKKITGFELTTFGKRPNLIHPSLKKFARYITSKVPNVKASLEPDTGYSKGSTAAKLVLQSPKKIKVKIFGPHASDITGLKNMTTRKRSVKCSK